MHSLRDDDVETNVSSVVGDAVSLVFFLCWTFFPWRNVVLFFISNCFCGAELLAFLSQGIYAFFCDFLDSRNNILKGKMYANTSTKKRERRRRRRRRRKRNASGRKQMDPSNGNLLYIRTHTRRKIKTPRYMQQIAQKSSCRNYHYRVTLSPPPFLHFSWKR